MQVTVTARHVDVDDELRRRAIELVEKVAKLVKRPGNAQVIFADDHGEAAVEIELTAPRGRVIIAKSVAPDQRSALDEAIARLKRQTLDDKESARPRRRSRTSNPR